MAEIDDDFFRPDVYADPYLYFGRIRDSDPVHWNKLYEIWVVTRYSDVVRVLRDGSTFSSDIYADIDSNKPRPPFPPVNPGDEHLVLTAQRHLSERIMHHDQPEHLAMRRNIAAHFTPSAVQAWRPLVQSVVRELLDRVDLNGHMDVIRDLASPLPLLIISELMGIPMDSRSRLQELAHKVRYRSREEASRFQMVQEGMDGFSDLIEPVLEERILRPQNDLISVFADCEKRGVLTRPQVLANIEHLLTAGHVTTTALVCNGIVAFIRHPEEWMLLKSDPTGLSAIATEECLRYDPPASGVGVVRLPTRNVDLGGKTIRRSERLCTILASANRDPDQFASPDMFHVTRQPNPHLTFAAGSHHCIGANLARMEGQEVFKAFAERFDSLQLETDTLEYEPSMGLRKLSRLEISWN